MLLSLECGRDRVQSRWAQGNRAALQRLLSVLRDAGTIAPEAQRPLTPPEQIFEAILGPNMRTSFHIYEGARRERARAALYRP
jgi:hypothetical protein